MNRFNVDDDLINRNRPLKEWMPTEQEKRYYEEMRKLANQCDVKIITVKAKG